MDPSLFKQQLEKDGFKNIYEWKDEPNTVYPKHRHKDKVSFYIIDGSLVFLIEDKVIELKSGDRFDVPPNQEHTAKVGSKVCVFIVGEMIEGDS